MQVTVTTTIDAPIERVFDLARDMDFHQRSLAHTGEVIVAGVRTGLIGLDESVTFRGKHFGLTQTFTARVTAFDRPNSFCDEMTRGAFADFRHTHEFESVGESTRMRDTIDFASPLGIVGRAVDRLFMGRYLCRLLRQRGDAIKLEAERQRAEAG